ncbi:hypothetical protein FRB90_007350, partial [Tulasnella sp. 427]
MVHRYELRSGNPPGNIQPNQPQNGANQTAPQAAPLAVAPAPAPAPVVPAPAVIAPALIAVVALPQAENLHLTGENETRRYPLRDTRDRKEHAARQLQIQSSKPRKRAPKKAKTQTAAGPSA